MTASVALLTAESDPPLANPAAESTTDATVRRWEILRIQLRTGHEPCFGTERRHACGERDTCEFRLECLTRRATWRR